MTRSKPRSSAMPMRPRPGRAWWLVLGLIVLALSIALPALQAQHRAGAAHHVVAAHPASFAASARIAQSGDPCPPVRIHLPFLQRGHGVPHIPIIIPRPSPDVRRPCPSATPGGSPTLSATATTTPIGGTPSATATGMGTPSATAISGSPTSTEAVTATPSVTMTSTARPELTPTEAPSPTATPTPSPTPTPTRTRLEGIFGVQAFERDLGPLWQGRFDEAGATWIRVRALWAGIEPNDTLPRTLNWGSLDSMIGTASARGLKPVVVVIM